MILIECCLKNADLNQLKQQGKFSYLENLILNGSNSYDHMGVVFVNIDNKHELSHQGWRKIPIMPGT